MLAGAGDTITVLEAVTPVAETVIDLEFRLALARVTVIVELHPLGAAQAILPLTLDSTCPSVHQLGTHVGIAHQSTRLLLFAHQVTRCH
jgi:hypothetical protein